MGDLLRILSVLLIVAGNAFFVAAEYALVTARRSHLGELASRGDHRAAVALEPMRTPLRFVSPVQLGITLYETSGLPRGPAGSPISTPRPSAPRSEPSARPRDANTGVARSPSPSEPFPRLRAARKASIQAKRARLPSPSEP